MNDRDFYLMRNNSQEEAILHPGPEHLPGFRFIICNYTYKRLVY